LAREVRREREEGARRGGGITLAEGREPPGHLAVDAPVAFRERIHDHAAAERPPRRLIAQDEAVAAPREHVLLEDELGPAGAARRERIATEDDELGHDLRRAEVEAHPGVARQRPPGRRADLHPGVEPARQPAEPLVADDVAAAEIATLDA